MGRYKYHRFFIIGGGAGVFLIAALLVLDLGGYRPSDIVGREMALRLRHTKISLAKASDILFAPYFFLPITLPVYELHLLPEELRVLNMPFEEWDPDALVPLPGEKKVWGRGFFSSDGYAGEVKVRYRGDSQVHWAHEKKSWFIEFPGAALFRGMARLHLSVPESQYYYVGALNDFRAGKFGMLRAPSSFVRLRLNGRDLGVYLASEDMGQEWLEKRGLTGFLLSFDGDTAEPHESIFSDGHKGLWKSSTFVDQYTDAPMAALRELLLHTDEGTFRALAPLLIDLDAFYRWDVMTVLSQAREQNDVPPSNNLRLFFDTATGKFSPVPYNIRIREDEGTSAFYEEIPLLTKRILSVPEFKNARDAILERSLYEERDRDLAFYDALHRQMKREFLGDLSKFNPNFSYLREVEKFRAYIAENFARAKNELTVVYKDDVGKARQPDFPESFRWLFDASRSPEEFASRHPEFVFEEPNILRLRAGTYVFPATLAIPAGGILVIDPGASLLFAQGVSLLSYSPVYAQGSAAQPIIFTALKRARPWGSFLVVATGQEKSVLRHISFSYGSETQGINGIRATGMVGFHGADVEIEESIFEGSQGEDALNVKHASVAVRRNSFKDTASDAFDCDTCSGLIEENTFRDIGIGVNTHKGFGNVGGDGIDVSFSDVAVRSNVVLGSTDKGISIGEFSHPVVERNIIAGAMSGIAVKDSSSARVRNTAFLGNRHGLELYRKKEIFGPASATISGSLLWSNEEDVKVFPDGSHLEFGAGNIMESRGAQKPDFASLLPPEVRKFIRK